MKRIICPMSRPKGTYRVEEAVDAPPQLQTETRSLGSAGASEPKMVGSMKKSQTSYDFILYYIIYSIYICDSIVFEMFQSSL